MKKLFLVFAISALLFSVCWSQSATDTTSVNPVLSTISTGIVSFSINTIKTNTSIGWVVSNHGKPRTVLITSIPLMQYYSNGTEYWDISVASDCQKSIYGIGNMDLVPVTDFTRSWLGKKNGKIKIPVFDYVIDNYVSFGYGVGFGYNFSDKKPELVQTIRIIKKTW